MRQRLEQFYLSFGDKGIMFILYVFSLVVNTLLTINMALPTVYPDEIAVAGTAAMYAGVNKWPLLESVGGNYGYIQALFYAPLYRVFNNQFALYKTMLVLNAIMISFIPMIIYHLAAKLGIPHVYQKLIIAVSCGMYISYIANSKFIWNETMMSLMCWLIILCFFNARDQKNRSARLVNSLLLGFLCAFGNAAGARMFAITVALVLTLIIARIVFHERIVNLPIFALSLALFFTAEYFLRELLAEKLHFGGYQISADNFFGKMFSQLYAFTTGTLGFGALAAAVTAIMLINLICEGTRRRVDTPESNTKVYEPIKHKYSMRLTLFAMFQFLAVILDGIYSVLFESSMVMPAADLAPLALFLVFVFIYLYGIELKQVLIGVGIYGYLCLCYALQGEPLNFAAGSLDGLIPISFFSGENTGIMQYIIMSSCVFTMFALLIVFAFCSRHNRTAFVTFSSFLVIVVATGYLGCYYMPTEAKVASAELEPFREVSALLYNDSQSPPIIVYKSDPRLAATIQFLEPHTSVSLMGEGEKAPENCLLIAENGINVPFERGSYENVGRTKQYTIYAFGESARDFMRYSSSKN